jgi:hypothetical protein
VGDIAYADAWLKEETSGYVTPLNETDGGKEYDKILNEFYVEVEEISRDVPYMVGPGEFLDGLVRKSYHVDCDFQETMRRIVTTVLT